MNLWAHGNLVIKVQHGKNEAGLQYYQNPCLSNIINKCICFEPEIKKLTYKS